MNTVIGTSIQRKEAWDKVTGDARYTADLIVPGTLHGKLMTSPHAHARILSIDVSKAEQAPGVQAVVIGKSHPILYGPLLEDHPPLAWEKVRYFGEPVALVVANSEREAQQAVKLVQVTYEPLPPLCSPGEALKQNAPLIHENLKQYKTAVNDIQPEPNTNVAERVKIRKGDMAQGWAESQVVVEASFNLPKSDHVAMETRAVFAEIMANGQVVITASTQAPFEVRDTISQVFGVEIGKITVRVPLVGGGFGGKAPVQLEMLAYMASLAVAGKRVKLVNTREEDLVTSPCRLGLEARIKLGATKEGILKAAEMTYLVDTGAYTDIGPRLTKSIAVACTGPYGIDHVWCDSLCVYTTTPYATSFRGFGHACYTFCIERALEKLALALGMDSLELRLKNVLGPDQLTPTQVHTTLSNLGSLETCFERLKAAINWEEGPRIPLENHKVRAKGISGLWKTSNMPTFISGILLTFNKDGSINLSSGVVEYGPGMKTTLAQLLAEKMKMDINRIHVKLEVDTQLSPEHSKTVASMTTYMAGRAVLRAAEDLITQLKELASVVMRSPAEELEVGEEKVYLKQNPTINVSFKDLVHGYQYPNGNAFGGQILGRGSFYMNHTTHLDPETGKGKTGPAWTVGAQAVEVEFDTKEFTYRVIKAVTVIDAGRVLNPKTARGLITGGMCMGLGLATREAFSFDELGKVENTSLRTYKVLHIGQEPEYVVEFVEIPQIDSPYGARGIGEHGTIGIPAALANALSTAAQVELDQLPLTPETIWKTKTGEGL